MRYEHSSNNKSLVASLAFLAFHIIAICNSGFGGSVANPNTIAAFQLPGDIGSSLSRYPFTRSTQIISPPPKPAPAPARWRGLIGEYGPDDNVLIIYEEEGKLSALFKRSEFYPVLAISRDVFQFGDSGPRVGQRLIFKRDSHDRATQVAIKGLVYKRRQIEPETGNQLRIKPVRPVFELMKEALAAQPPPED